MLGISGLHAGYGSSIVLRDVSLEVPPGSVACLMGRNGAGKTTLLRALMGALPRTGTVQLDGRDISDWNGHRINRAGMVWVPQEDAVFPGLTVREHLFIALGRRARDAGLAEAAELFPILGERMDQEAQTLSGGERKMLGIAQALIVRPKLVLMDEPTEGVAPIIVEQLQPAIRVLTESAAVLLVEQNIDTALALGSQAYVLEHGTIVEAGDIRRLYDDGVLERRLGL
ncbi:MAG TPA: ABC transporter ATP-binding protein [Candidatus Limnocylindria bacterium]|nr:ABC transporter ATP-binding protein [Candidatus Limnocylindria bacterium]